MDDIDFEKIAELEERFAKGEVSRSDVKHELHDLISIKLDDYEKLFKNLDDAVAYNGHYWRHNSKSSFSSISWRFDKYTQEECFRAIEKLNPTTSVVARKSTRELVEPHCVHKFILKLDVTKYYESIDFTDISDSLIKSGIDDKLRAHIEQFYFSDGKSLRRGLSASPILSEFIGLKIDNLVSKILYELNHKEVPYTRFYDDILLSGDDKELLRSIEQRLTEGLAALGLTVSKRKTRIQPTHTANILGLRIHDGKLVVPKSFKKRLRARIDSLDRHLNDLHKNGGWEDSDEVYEAKRRIGTVIGSHWYVVNNSTTNTTRYSNQLDHYYKVLAAYSRQLDYLLEREDIIEYAD